MSTRAERLTYDAAVDALIAGDLKPLTLHPGAVVVALVHANKALSVLERCGASAALRALASHRVRHHDAQPLDQALYVARRVTTAVQLFLRVRQPLSMGRPLVRSLAVCAACRAVGLKSQIVFARRANALPGGRFHAWAALGDAALTELTSQQFGYYEVARWPPL